MGRCCGFGVGFAILVRLTSLLETAVFSHLRFHCVEHPSNSCWHSSHQVLCAFLVDHWHQWFRFGELFSTYMGVFGRQARPSGAPASFPFFYPFWKGFLGTLFSADKSIFLFDPLLLVLCVVLMWNWRTISGETRTAILAGSSTGALYQHVRDLFRFRGRCRVGPPLCDRPGSIAVSPFRSAVAQVPGRDPECGAPSGLAHCVWFCCLQAASTAVAPNLEVLQREMGYGHGVVVDRGINLAQLALDREVRGSERIPIEWHSLYYLHYLPFQLRFRFPALARLAIAVWVALLVCLFVLVSFVIRFIKTEGITALSQHSRPPHSASGVG